MTNGHELVFSIKYYTVMKRLALGLLHLERIRIRDFLSVDVVTTSLRMT
jgi:hypothetical protein